MTLLKKLNKIEKTEELNTQRIAIFHPEGYLESVPCLMSLIELFIENDYRVDVFYSGDKRFPYPKVKMKNVELIEFPGGRNPSPLLHSGNIFRWIFYFLFKYFRLDYKFFIGVDPLGLISASIISGLYNKPLIYLSLELYLSEDLKGPARLLKMFERISHRRADLTLIQSEERASLLSTDNNVPIEKMGIIPNSPIGVPPHNSSSYLRKKYNISPNSKIILHIGSIGKWTCFPDLVRNAENWPADWTLILHGRESGNLSAEAASFTKSGILPPNVILSLEPVSLDQLDTLVASADIGLALYKEGESSIAKKNIRAIGQSSGKIAYYLRNGLPIVTSNFPSLYNIINKYKCGITVNGAEEVNNAINEILTDYKWYSKNARICSNEVFNFELSFKKVLKQIDKLKK